MPSVRQCGASPLSASACWCYTLGCFSVEQPSSRRSVQNGIAIHPSLSLLPEKMVTCPESGHALPTGVVLDAFSAGGEFETTFAKSFVVSAYQMWEEVTRGDIAKALGTSHNDIRSDLMGEWRHLRHWLVHPK